MWLKCMWMGSWLIFAAVFGMVVFGALVEDVGESAKGSKDEHTAPKGS